MTTNATNFFLIPPELTLKPVEIECANQTSMVVSTNLEHTELYVTQCIDVKHLSETIKEAPLKLACWGILQLHCNLTGRTARLHMPVQEDMPLQTINHTHLIGMFAASNITILALKREYSHYLGEDLLFIDGDMTTFHRQYTELSLVVPEGDEVRTVHVFWEGDKKLHD